LGGGSGETEHEEIDRGRVFYRMKEFLFVTDGGRGFSKKKTREKRLLCVRRRARARTERPRKKKSRSARALFS
jgi:hypothetical protein